MTSQLLDHLGESGTRRVHTLAKDVVRSKGCQPTMEQRVGILIDLFRDAASSSMVYVVIDACDECSDFTGSRNIRFLEQLLDLQFHGNHVPSCGEGSRGIRLFLTTRDTRLLPNLVVNQCTKLSLLHNENVALDIKTYARAKVLQMGDKAIAAMRRAPDEEHGDLAEKVIHNIAKCSDDL